MFLNSYIFVDEEGGGTTVQCDATGTRRYE
jgi:hypothetical protein